MTIKDKITFLKEIISEFEIAIQILPTQLGSPKIYLVEQQIQLKKRLKRVEEESFREEIKDASL